MRWAFALCAVLVGCDGCREPAPISDGSAPTQDASTTTSDAGALSKEAVAKFLNPGNLPVYDGETAILEGNVFVRGPAAPELPPPATSTCRNVRDFRLFREGAADESGRRPLADAIVGVTGYDVFVPPKGDAVEITVKDCAFDRRTLAMTYGQHIEVKNAEALNSGIFYLPKLTKGRAPSDMVVAPGQVVKLYMNELGRALLVDGMAHGHLYADVFVARSALHVVSDRNGHFILAGIPVGTYEVNVLHPAFDAGKVHAKLTFKPGQTTHHDFELTYLPADGDGGAPSADAGR